MAKRSVGMVLAEYLDNQKKREGKDDIETVMNLVELPLLNQKISNSIISTTSNDLSNWSRLSSLWPLLYGTSCCFIEFASLIGSRFDFDRYGLVPRSSPRQADLILTAGTVTMKMAPSLVRLYEQMPEPKYVIAMGACTITGGMFSTDSYSTVRGVDKLIPVDVYLPGCPPKPEAIIDAIMKLRKKISRKIFEDKPCINRRIDVLLLITVLPSTQYSYWKLRPGITLSITIYFRDTFWILNFFQNPKGQSIFLRISELGRVSLCIKRKSGSIFKNFIVNVKYSYKEKCGRDEEDAGSFI
uniref:NAD(P)H-quinone oxidoreductase subunit K, chloroplastic n=1 Tax=Ludisia discolor TaxID=60011 RepID=A0A191TFL7_LUDDI|nr:NADH-plastoquinone oxidoreductase subunit K [Ludisia discolor]ANI87420.1 NADH-plastoquinone oxidoreductase subunit K [Ludisia discolor]